MFFRHSCPSPTRAASPVRLRFGINLPPRVSKPPPQLLYYSFLCLLTDSSPLPYSLRISFYVGFSYPLPFNKEALILLGVPSTLEPIRFF